MPERGCTCYFFIQLTSNLLLRVSGAPRGIAFPRLHTEQSDSISSFDVLTFLHTFILPVEIYVEERESQTHILILSLCSLRENTME